MQRRRVLQWWKPLADTGEAEEATESRRSLAGGACELYKGSLGGLGALAQPYSQT